MAPAVLAESHERPAELGFPCVQRSQTQRITPNTAAHGRLLPMSDSAQARADGAKEDEAVVTARALMTLLANPREPAPPCTGNRMLGVAMCRAQELCTNPRPVELLRQRQRRHGQLTCCQRPRLRR